MSASLVGSEMCIRDRAITVMVVIVMVMATVDSGGSRKRAGTHHDLWHAPVSYTHLTLPTSV
eukprot:3219286-Alexandrium_andersonii.AAC.1